MHNHRFPRGVSASRAESPLRAGRMAEMPARDCLTDRCPRRTEARFGAAGAFSWGQADT